MLSVESLSRSANSLRSDGHTVPAIKRKREQKSMRNSYSNAEANEKDKRERAEWRFYDLG